MLTLKHLQDHFHTSPHDEIIHLNAAGISPMLPAVSTALQEIILLHTQGTFGIGSMLQRYEEARIHLGRFLDCPSGNISFFQTCAMAISQVAFGFPLTTQDNIVTIDQEYPSNAYPWMRAARQSGAQLRTVQSRKNTSIDIEEILKAIDSHTRIVAVSAVQYQTGSMVDCFRLSQACKKHGAILVVDAIQAVGSIPFSVTDLGIDVLCGGGHKWLMGPLSSGFAAMSSTVREQLMPLAEGAITYGTPDDSVDAQKTMRTDVKRFEPGNPLLWGAIGMGAACQTLSTIGIKSIHHHAHQLAILIEEQAQKRGLLILGDSLSTRMSPIVTFQTGKNDIEIVKRLIQKGVACTARANGIRFAPHGLNTTHDVEKAFSILDEVLFVD